jgi:hypothetical protein
MPDNAIKQKSNKTSRMRQFQSLDPIKDKQEHQDAPKERVIPDMFSFAAQSASKRKHSGITHA